MKKYPIPQNEKQRLKALHDYEILDSLSEVEFDRITELASIICDVPISLISLIDENRQWFKSKVGLGVNETSRDLAFCTYAIMDADILEVEDATKDDRFKNNNLVISDPNIRFYAGYPLIDLNGYALGTLCVIDRKPKVLSATQKRALQLLSEDVTTLIIERRQKEELKNFEKLFKLSNDLICVAGVDGYFKKINPAFEKLLGWSSEYLLQTSFFDLVHPDDLQITHDEIQRLAQGYNTVNFTHRFRTKGNLYKVLQWVATPEVTTDAIFAIARDVSEEIQNEKQLAVSEERLRIFFENSQGLMCTHDLLGNFLSVNSAGASILGYTKEEISAMSLYDIVPKERHPFIDAYLAEIKANGTAKGQMITQSKNGAFHIWMYNNVLENDQIRGTYVIGNAVDITERYNLERDLKRTTEMLEQTNTVARVGGWEMDVKKGTLYWTDVTKEIHGVSLDFIPDLSTAINFYKEGESRDKIVEAISRAINNGDPWDVELQIIKQQGNEIWVRAIGNPEFENGSCKRLYGTFQDIDEKKKTELEVINAKRLFDDVLHAASEVSIIATDVNGIITVFNTGAERLLGYSMGEILGIKSPAILHDPDEVGKRSKELTAEFGYPIEGFRVFVQKTETEGSEQREWTYIRKDGLRLTVSLVVTAMRNYENTIIGYLGIATDITEKKKAENALMVEQARLTAFVQHAPAAVAMVDNHMNFVAVSNKWLEDFQLTGRPIIGTSYYDAFPFLTEVAKERHKRCLRGVIERKDEDIYRPPGSDVDTYVTWEMRPWYHFDGSIGGLMIFTQNITSIINQREDLKAAKILAEQASIAKSEFLANMSHEIRTPLNGVIGFTDLVLKTKLNETQQQYLTIVNQSANALLSIINDILDFSKIEAGKLELDIEKCDLYELGCQATDIITYQVQTKGLEMLLNISPDLPRFIWTDAVRLKQILINLLGNASKFTEQGEIELKIQALATDGDHTTVRFGVRDTGIGIKPEKQDKIFEAFSQEDGSTTKKYGGTGLGLTISNRLLGLMGSKLQLQSTPRVGSFFYFDITLKSEQGEPIDWENIELVKKVLVVDDNDNNRMILNQMLLLKQIQTVEAKNGFEALQLLASGNHYDVILMDYHMPFMDGLETIRKIRESFYPSPDEQPIILLYSSSDDEKVIKACEALKVNKRLIKPIKIQDIYNVLARLHKKASEYSSSGDAREDYKAIEPTEENITILIAEDNTVNMLLAKTIMKRIAPNANVQEANNGLDAFKQCESAMPDIIFMDIQMPVMNGYEATQKIRKLPVKNHVPIIALTAANVKSEKEKCLDAGMDDFIVKPIVEEAIAAVFYKWIHVAHQKPITGMMIDEQEELAHFDVAKIKSYIGDDEAILKEVIDLVIKELTQAGSALQMHSESKNLKGLNATGHKLYGTSATTGLSILAKLAHEFEYLDHFIEDDVEKRLTKIKNEIDLILSIILKL